MPLEWLLGFQTASRSLVNARVAGRRGGQAARAGSSQRIRLQLEALETRCLLSAADVLVVTTPPPSIGWPGGPGSAGIVAGAPFGMTVKAQKADGTVDTSYNGTVTIVASAVGSADPGYALHGALTVTAVNGVATFSGLTEDKVVQLSLIITGSGLPDTAVAYASPFTQAGPAAQLVVSGPAASTYLQSNHSGPLAPFITYFPVAKAPFGLEVQYEDALGNTTDYDGDLTIALANNPTGATLGGTLTVHSTGSFVDLDNLILDSVGSGYTLQATALGLAAGTSPAFGVVDHLVVTTQPPSTITAGSSFGLVVKAEDGLGNLDTHFNGSVGVDSEEGLPLGGTLTVTAVNGVTTFSGLTKAQVSSSSLEVFALPRARSTASDLPSNGSTDPIQVTAAPATQLVVARPSEVVTGAPYSLKVEAQDPFGNVDPTYNGNVTIALANNPTGATLTGTLSVTAVNGVATFNGLAISNPGTGYTLTAGSGALTAGTSPVFDVTNDQTQLVVSISAGNILTDAPFSIQVKAEDPFGHVRTTFNGAVTLALDGDPDNATLRGTLTVTAINGVASFPGLAIDNPGSAYTLKATSSGLIAGASAPIAVTSDQLVVTTAPPSNLTAGTPFSVVIMAKNGHGSLDTNFNGSVTITSKAGNALGGTLTVTAINGVATFTGLTDNIAGSDQLVITASGLGTATTGEFQITAARATHFGFEWVWSGAVTVVTGHSENILAGAPFYVQAVALDPFGNADRSFTGSATLALASNPTGATLGGTLTIPLVTGFANFSQLTIDTVGSGYAFVVSGANLTTATSASFSVTSKKLVVTTPPPANYTPGIPFGLTVAVEDSSGNVDTSFGGTVTVSLYGVGLASDILAGTLTVTAVHGVATFTDLTLNQRDDVTLFLTSDDVAGTTSTFFNEIQANPGGPIEPTGVPDDPVSRGLFVTALYRDVLGRAPDSTGLSHWEDQLQAGASRQLLAQAFWQSPEHRMLEVTTYYGTLLQRAPDTAGLTHWVQMLENGASESAVEYGFLTSQEYLTKSPSVSAFLGALYEELLGRTASVAEIDSWQSQIFGSLIVRTSDLLGKAGLIASGILDSPEASKYLIDLNFSQFLQRNVDPIGEEYWLAAVQSGTSPTALAEAILGSDEYYTLVASS
jgi:Domain of unknown function (DUF4214)